MPQWKAFGEKWNPNGFHTGIKQLTKQKEMYMNTCGISIQEKNHTKHSTTWLLQNTISKGFKDVFNSTFMGAVHFDHLPLKYYLNLPFLPPLFQRQTLISTLYRWKPQCRCGQIRSTFSANPPFRHLPLKSQSTPWPTYEEIIGNADKLHMIAMEQRQLIAAWLITT